MSAPADEEIIVRQTRPEDFPAIEAISRRVYPHDQPWSAVHLQSHQQVFPEGQFVALSAETGTVVGTAMSLIIRWDDYDYLGSYNEFTDHGFFRNHDPNGRTLYGAEVMVDPLRRGEGIGSALYDARRALTERLGLLRIRAGARLPGYYRYAHELGIEEYIERVEEGILYDPTLSFQLKNGFRVVAVVPDYYEHDPKGLEYAALIEWINDAVARPDDPIDPRHRARKG